MCIDFRAFAHIVKQKVRLIKVFQTFPTGGDTKITWNINLTANRAFEMNFDDDLYCAL